jgi:hypothetical protein
MSMLNPATNPYSKWREFFLSKFRGFPVHNMDYSVTLHVAASLPCIAVRGL